MHETISSTMVVLNETPDFFFIVVDARRRFWFGLKFLKYFQPTNARAARHQITNQYKTIELRI